VANVALCREVHAGTRGFSMTYSEVDTGPDGRFFFVGARFPTRLVAACLPRLLGAEVRIDKGTDSDLQVRLEPHESAGVSGTVASFDGSPIPGAAVLVARHVNDGRREVAATRADGEGRFAFASLLPDTQYEFVPVVGAVHGPSVLRVAKPGTTLECRLAEPSAESAIAGTVKDRRGQPVGGIRVAFAYLDGGQRTTENISTRSDGTFQATGLLRGRYQVFVDERGYAAWYQDVEVSGPGTPTHVEIDLVATRTVRFTLSEASGLPVAAARVIGEKTRVQAVWAADGRYAVDILDDETRLNDH